MRSNVIAGARRLSISVPPWFTAVVRTVFVWLRRMAGALLCLLFVAWIGAEASQWLFRREAEQLLANVRPIQPGVTTSAEAESILKRWDGQGVIRTGCAENKGANCYSEVLIRHLLPEFLRGKPDDGAMNLLPRVVDGLGLRSSVAGALIRSEGSVVAGRSYLVEIDLPVRDWYLREGAYVPSLAVSSMEALRFRDFEQERVVPTHPFRMAQRFKGSYGLGVKFTTEEPPSERAKLMDFHLSCVTQFFPCGSEREILASGADLLDKEE